MTRPWLDERPDGTVEINTGSADVMRLNTGANQTVEIDKLYGSLCAGLVRVRLEYHGDVSDWVVEYQNPTTERWEEKARWDCQENWPKDPA